MEKALAKLKNGEFKEVYAEEFRIGKYLLEDVEEFRCIGCNEIAHICKYQKKIWCFAATHDEDCIYVTDGRKHPIVRVKDHTVVDLYDILNYEDRRIIERPERPDGGDDLADEPQGEEVDGENHDNGPDAMNINDNENHLEDAFQIINDIDGDYITEEEREELAKYDKVYKYITQVIKSVGPLYGYLLKEGLDTEIGQGLKGIDILLTENFVMKARDGQDLSGIKLAVLQRADIKQLNHKFIIPKGYSLMRDAYAADPNNSILFLVKLPHEQRNAEFRNKLMGEKDNRHETIDKHRNIIVLGDFKRYSNDYYYIYMADINTHSYKFINIKKHD